MLCPPNIVNISWMETLLKRRPQSTNILQIKDLCITFQSMMDVLFKCIWIKEKNRL